MSTVACLLLSELLDCRPNDLEMLEECTYEVYDLVETAREIDEHPTLNNYIEAMFKIGLSVLRDSINDLMVDLEQEAASGELTDDDREKLAQIRKLNPTEDIEMFINFRDTHITFAKNEELYQKYFEENLEHFHNGTGFWIGG